MLYEVSRFDECVDAGFEDVEREGALVEDLVNKSMVEVWNRSQEGVT